MPPADATVRIPVAVLNLFQLACPAAIFCAAALHLPAVEYNLPEEARGTLFNTPYSQEVLLANTICAVLGLVQTFVIRDPLRGTSRYKYGIGLEVLAFIGGLAAAHGAYRVGLTPLDEIEARPLIGTYVALFSGLGFSAFAFIRLERFFERTPAAPQTDLAT
jgi:hypothetical protein